MSGPRLAKPIGSIITFLLILVILAGPLWLFAERLTTYRLHSDDFAFVGASRTFSRAIENLYRPHNTHIVPAWRLLTWAVVCASGRLANLQTALAVLSYTALLLAMLGTGWLVARETGHRAVGLAAMIGMGTTSLLTIAATWYSAGQPLWAGVGLLGMLLALQGWRRAGGLWRLVLAGFAAWLAGGFWTLGHAAGPVGAVYLWTDGRPRCRKAAVVPLLATALAVGSGYALGAGQIASKQFQVPDRPTEGAIHPWMGLKHTIQSIPEMLVFGNLGLAVETTFRQGLVLTLGLAAAWGWSRRRRGRGNPLEYAGITLVVICYVVEWSFRGWLPFSSLRHEVPWYHALPHLGAVLFVSGWWAGRAEPLSWRRAAPVTRAGVLGVLLFLIGMLMAHRPRAESIFMAGVTPMSAEEEAAFPTRDLQHLRARYLAEEIAAWQRRFLLRLDQAEVVARRRGIGREAISRTFGRVEAPEIPDAYDAVPMLDLPREGTENDPAVIRRTLGPFFNMEPEPTLPLDALQKTSRKAAKAPRIAKKN